MTKFHDGRDILRLRLLQGHLGTHGAAEVVLSHLDRHRWRQSSGQETCAVEVLAFTRKQERRGALAERLRAALRARFSAGRAKA